MKKNDYVEVKECDTTIEVGNDTNTNIFDNCPVFLTTYPDDISTPYFDFNRPFENEVEQNYAQQNDCKVYNENQYNKINDKSEQDKIIKIKNPEMQMNIEDDKKNLNSYNFVNNPDHYMNYDMSVYDMMRKIWGDYEVMIWCKLTAWKYRQRMGTKPGESIQRDLDKEKWYLEKYNELKEKLDKN